jgi:uncharacterized protein (TIRG00374 family)
MKRRRRWFLTAVRIGVCLAAIALLVYTVNWRDQIYLNDAARTKARLLEERASSFLVERGGQVLEVPREQVARLPDGTPEIRYGIASVVRRAKGLLALAAVLIFLPVPLLQSIRLVWMLAIQDVRLSYWNSIKLSYAGNFFNFALPGTVGGDLIKAYYITRFTHQKTEAVTTVFLDRAIGLLGLVLLAGTMIIIVWDRERFGSLALILGLLIAGLVAGAILVFSKRIRHALRLPEIAERLPLSDQILRIGRATVAMRRHKALVVAALANTIVLQFTVMVSAFVMARALSMDGTFAQYLIYVPIGFLIAAIPINPPQAVGVLELAYVGFFRSIGGNTASQAFALAFAVRLIQLVWAIPGVLVPLLGAHLPSAAELRALEAAAEQASNAVNVTPAPTPATEPAPTRK